MDKKYVDRFLEAINGTAEHTKTCYISTVSLYSGFIGNREPTIDNAKLFLQNLKDNNYSTSAINRHMAALKRFFRAIGIPWDENVKSKTVNLFLTNAPTMYIDSISAVVSAVRQSGNVVDMSYLALSTIYGLRRAELANLEDIDINRRRDIIHIKTMKGGIERDHLIPPEISFIKEYTFEVQSVTTMSTLFSKICLLAGHNKQDNEGWHAIRRCLVNELYSAEISEPRILLFLRWAPNNMGMRYNIQGINPIVADRMIFERHPFLPFWR